MKKSELENVMTRAFGQLALIQHEADTSFLAIEPLSITEARLYDILRLQGAVLNELVKALPDEISI